MHPEAVDSAFDDSEFDGEEFISRPSPLAALPASEMDRLLWVVLVALSFCPAVGFALALLWF